MNYTKKVLENGLRIVLVPMHDAQTVTVMVLAETGSDYETAAQNGISHFLEHMCFKGTTKRPSSAIINYELDSIGSQSNAFTSNEYTGFYAKAHAKHTSKIIDIVSDIYLHSTFPAPEIEKEKGVIIEEINMYEDRPESKVGEVLDEKMYQGQASGRAILGTKETVRAITREDLLKYHRERYVAETTLVVVSGKIDEEKVITEICEAFKEVKVSTKIAKEKTVDKQKKVEVVIHHKKADQTHLILGYRSFDTYDKRDFAASLLATILGQGMSSRLFTKLREELGVCYYVRASHSTSADHGAFYISAGVSNDRLEEAVKAIVTEVKKLVNEKVDLRELQKAKDFRIGNFFLNLESSDAYADFYGFQEIMREKVLSPEEVVKRIEGVTAEDIQNVARDIFMAEKATLAMVGPHEDSQKFCDIISDIS